MSEYVPRSGGDVAQTLMALLPRGPVWPRRITSQLYLAMRGIAEVSAYWFLDVARFLVVEAFPPTSLDLLPDWERVLGLPDPCVPIVDQTIAERQEAVREKLGRRPGRQDRDFFYELAQRLGYTITITEYVPAQCARTPCGVRLDDTAPYLLRGAGCGSPAIRFVWSIAVEGPRLTWFAHGAGGGRTGRGDPHLRIARAEDLECILARYKPAHTRLVFNYVGV